jgi:4-diphosphocytidyl-2-C-methyl-D-erythritol kinase
MSQTVTEIAKAKINLALHVLGRRADGYHAIDSAVAFAEAGDVLRVEAVPGQGVTINVTGPFASLVPAGDDNLISRAHALLAQHVALPAVRVDLQKNLPVAAGIGGGSADAAAALRACLRLVGTPVPESIVHAIALTLGADVPVCLQQKACRMQGVGEILSPLQRLPADAIVLVNPGVACETAAVFKALSLAKEEEHKPALVPDDPRDWRNDLTAAAVQVQPIIADVLELLQKQDTLLAVRMSGSGATCFGLAASRADAVRVADIIRAARPDWWVLASRLS